jgi:hypothetical protein
MYKDVAALWCIERLYFCIEKANAKAAFVTNFVSVIGVFLIRTVLYIKLLEYRVMSHDMQM